MSERPRIEENLCSQDAACSPKKRKVPVRRAFQEESSRSSLPLPPVVRFVETRCGAARIGRPVSFQESRDAERAAPKNRPFLISVPVWPSGDWLPPRRPE